MTNRRIVQVLVDFYENSSIIWKFYPLLYNNWNGSFYYRVPFHIFRPASLQNQIIYKLVTKLILSNARDTKNLYQIKEKYPQINDTWIFMCGFKY